MTITSTSIYSQDHNKINKDYIKYLEKEKVITIPPEVIDLQISSAIFDSFKPNLPCLYDTNIEQLGFYVSYQPVDRENLILKPGFLPQRLKRLHLVTSEPILADVLPNTIKSMSIVCDDQCDINSGFLPLSLEIYSTINKYMAKQQTIFPPGLRFITLFYYNSEIFQYLPQSIHTIYLPHSNRTDLEPGALDHLPNLSFLFNITFNSLKHLPASVKNVTLSYCNLEDKVILPGAIPSQLIYMDFGALESYKLMIGSIPPNMKSVYLRNYITELQPGIIPDGVTYVHLGVLYAHPIKPFDIPSSVNRLVLAENQAIPPIQPNVLPESIKELGLGRAYNHQILPNVLPPNLESLTLGSTHLTIIRDQSLPKTLTVLNLESALSCMISKHAIAREHPVQSEYPSLTLYINASFFRDNKFRNLPGNVGRIFSINKDSTKVELRRIDKNYFLVAGQDSFVYKGGFINSDNIKKFHCK